MRCLTCRRRSPTSHARSGLLTPHVCRPVSLQPNTSTNVITHNAVFNVLPFGNFITVKRLKGADIVLTIEEGMTGTMNGSETTGGFLQVGADV
jgi:hypothetical protein